MGDSVHVGCCGFCVKQEEYFSRFHLLEVQKTFYKPPRVETARRWRERAPKDFVFTVKAWQLITHPSTSPTYRKAGIDVSGRERAYGYFRPTREVLEAWETTARIAEVLRAPIVIFQTPASFAPTDENVENISRFFGNIDRHGLVLGWESRGAWPPELIREITKKFGLMDVVDPFRRFPETERTAYFRLHGRGGYRYRYTDDDLNRLLEWCEAFEEAYCLFNNVYMAEDAVRFVEMLERKWKRN